MKIDNINILIMSIVLKTWIVSFSIYLVFLFSNQSYVCTKYLIMVYPIFAEKLLTMAHTILLVQPGIKPETRTYSDYESVNECMEGVCKIYEEHLKRTNPNLPSITYDISQLFEFVDQVKK